MHNSGCAYNTVTVTELNSIKGGDEELQRAVLHIQGPNDCHMSQEAMPRRR